MSSATSETDGDGEAQIPDHFTDNYTAIQRDFLVAIGKLDAPSGQMILDYLHGVGYDEINHGRLYPNLDKLVECGLIDRGQKDRRTNAYTLTDDGRSALAEYRAWLTGGESDE